MNRLLIATTNPAKLAEYRLLLRPFELEVLSLSDVGIAARAPETGPTFEENARLKAAFYFARANVALYIESVYDAHFTLAQIGKKVLDGYGKLGDGKAFGAALVTDEVEALARAYSEAKDRLHPHVGVRLGS